MGLRVGLDKCGKSRHRRDSIPGPSSLKAVALPTELPGPINTHVTSIIFRSLNISKFFSVISKQWMSNKERGKRQKEEINDKSTLNKKWLKQSEK